MPVAQVVKFCHLNQCRRRRHLAGLEQLLLDVVERAGVQHEDLALREPRQLGVTSRGCDRAS